MPTEPRDITIRCDECGHTESFTSDTRHGIGNEWEQPCNKCGHNWHTITEAEA